MSKKDGKCFFKQRYATSPGSYCRYCGRESRYFGMSEKSRKESEAFYAEPCKALLELKQEAVK